MAGELDKMLGQVQSGVKTSFQSVRRILSFSQYLGLLGDDPARHLRSAAQYLVAMFEHFGSRQIEHCGAPVRRFCLFDGDFGWEREFLSGQEQVQEEIYRILKGQAQEGRSDKFLLLHGPNGSSKTTVVNMIFRGLEHYSHTDDGALYRFNWIFPRPQSNEEQRLGFGGGVAGGEAGLDGQDTFAFLPPEDIAARVPCELRDSPLLLVPRDERLEILRAVMSNSGGGLETVPEWLRDGDLDPKSKAIYEGLLTGYQGDWMRVIRHVQVERYFISRRFRTGVVRIDPQMHVDAGVRQITGDRSAEFLPATLRDVRILEPVGDLVDANHGALEYSDFLKRPIDMNKYLLGTVENGLVSLPGLLMHLDLVFLGTTNENHLDAFKQTLDYGSFQGRMEFVQVPYLLRWSDEEAIYRDVLAAIARRRPVLPHVGTVAAMWAVLTRLKRPKKQNYPEAVGRLIDRLTPLEKAKLYQRCESPAWLSDEEKHALLDAVGEIGCEFTGDILYEGRFGASPREMRGLITEASYRQGAGCLSPLHVLEVLREFVKEKNIHEFLNMEPDGRYHDHAQFVDIVCSEYHGLVTAELEDAMDLIDVREYERKSGEYFRHVVAFSRGEKVESRSTGVHEPPDDRVMKAVEDLLDLKEPPEDFRRNLVARIGAFRVDHPQAPVVYADLFPDIFAALKHDFFSRRREQVEQVEEDLLAVLCGGPDVRRTKAVERAEQTVANLESRFGYVREGLAEIIQFVRRHRTLNG